MTMNDAAVNNYKDLVPMPFELRAAMIPNEKYQTIDNLIDGGSVTYNGQLFKIMGLDNVAVHLISKVNIPMTVEQIIYVSDDTEPIIEQKFGKIIRLDFPIQMFKDKPTGQSGFKLITGEALVSIESIAMTKPSLLASGGSLAMGKQA